MTTTFKVKYVLPSYNPTDEVTALEEYLEQFTDAEYCMNSWLYDTNSQNWYMHMDVYDHKLASILALKFSNVLTVVKE